MTDNELLLSISSIMDKKLYPLEKRMDAFDEKLDKVEERLSAEIRCLDTKIDNVERRVVSLEHKVDSVEQRVVSLEHKVDSVEQRVVTVERKVVSLEQNLKDVQQNLKDDIHLINLKLENMVMPRLNEIESCYLSTSKRYMQETDKFIAFDTDLSVVKGIVLEHGNRLKAIGA